MSTMLSSRQPSFALPSPSSTYLADMKGKRFSKPSSSRHARYEPENYATSESLTTDQAMSVDKRYSSKLNDGNTAPTDSAPNGISHASPMSQGPEASFQSLGKVVEEVVSRLRELEDVGVEQSHINLPKVVLVGDQSSGKSSLIEGLTEIEVPRASGSCTRCPLLINTTNTPGAPWSCTLKIVKKFHYYGSIHAIAATAPDENPWQITDDVEDVYECQVDSKVDLKKTLWLAQRAILNPGYPPNAIMAGKTPKEDQVAFSPNVIKLEIGGNTLPTLQLYDLPGIISQIESSKDRYLPDLVRDMAKQYMQDENTIVVLAMSMNTDPHVSSAAGLVREVHAQDRCLGVLTKPDLLPAGDSLDYLKDMLAGRKFSLGFGYLSCRQPSSEELKSGISHASARAKEVEMFTKHAPWNNELRQFRERFGTVNLQVRLSRLLAGVVTKSLPSMISNVQRKLELIESDLTKYPKPPDDGCLSIVFNLIHDFRTGVEKTMLGEYRFNAFILQWRALVENYRKILFDAKPIVYVNVREPESQWKQFPSSSQPINLDSDDEDNSTPCPTSGVKRSFSQTPSTPANKRQKTPSSKSGYARDWRLEDVLEIQNKARTSGIPSAMDPRADEELISKAMTNWKEPLQDFLDQVNNHVYSHVEQLVAQVFQDWNQTALFSVVQECISNYLQKVLFWHGDNATRFLDSELYKPLIFDEEILEYRRQKELETISSQRRTFRAKALLNYREAITGKQSVGPERLKKLKSLQEGELGPDPFKDQVETMARVRAYYTSAASIMVEAIAKMQNFEVFSRCQQEMGKALEDGLGIGGRDGLENCRRLLAEDPEREAARSKLEKERVRLLNAKSLLESMPKY